MRQRSISAIGVVIVGILPAIMGGPVFAAVFVVLFLMGLQEYNAMAANVGNAPLKTGFVVVPAFALVALVKGGDQAAVGVAAFAVGAPLIWVMFRKDLNQAFVDWALTVGGSFYLGIPLVAAIALRSSDGAISHDWLSNLADTLSFGWDANPRGLAWLLTRLIITWMGDSGAYLVGRAFGKHPMIPRISPKKTMEGLTGGLICASITGVAGSQLFGLDIPIWAGFAFGLLVGAIGVFGDLVESLLKRQAGVKDSGTLIPGHGGMLDRLDALLFTWTAGWFLSTFIDRWV